MIADWMTQTPPAVVALGWTLVDFCWQGLLIGLVYALLRALGGRDALAWRNLLGRLAALAFLLAPLLGFLHRWGEAQSAQSIDAQTAVANALPAITAGVDDAIGFEQWLPLAVLAWALGVGALAARGLLHWLRLRRLCAQSTPLADTWQQRLAELQARIGVRMRVRLLESARAVEPILVGWLRPVIVLPVGLCLRLPTQQVEMILAHELAHVRRFDAWLNALLMTTQMVFFYHPAVHWVARRVREDCELGCDALVAAAGLDRYAYARALLALAETRVRPLPPEPSLALAATGGLLLDRVERLLDAPERRSARLSRVLPAALLATGVGLFALPAADRDATTPALLPLGIVQISTDRMRPALDILVGDLPTVRLRGALVIPAAAPVAETAAPTTLAVAPLPITPLPLPLPPAAVPPTVPDAAPALPRLESVSAVAPHALLRTAPVYPVSARLDGLEGSVALSFSVAADGRATQIRVESADHEVFIGAARTALAQWRFPTDATGERYLQRFDFNLDGLSTAEDIDSADAPTPAPTNVAATPTCRRATGSRLCRPAP